MKVHLNEQGTLSELETLHRHEAFLDFQFPNSGNLWFQAASPSGLSATCFSVPDQYCPMYEKEC